jgi:hypothetical protein
MEESTGGLTVIDQVCVVPGEKDDSNRHRLTKVGIYLDFL